MWCHSCVWQAVVQVVHPAPQHLAPHLLWKPVYQIVDALWLASAGCATSMPSSSAVVTLAVSGPSSRGPERRQLRKHSIMLSEWQNQLYCGMLAILWLLSHQCGMNSPAVEMHTPAHEQWKWADVAAYVDLNDTSTAAEAARVQLVTNVFMYELQNCNAAYQHHAQQQQSLQQQQHEKEQCRDSCSGSSRSSSKSSSQMAQYWHAWHTSSLRQQIYMTLTFPEHSSFAGWMNACIMTCVLWSTAMFCVESVPSIQNSRNMTWINATEDACLVIFTIEFVGRISTCPSLIPFITSPMNIIDFAAIFPSYVELLLAVTGREGGGASQTQLLRLLRLLRVLRLLRLCSRLQHMRIIVDALWASADVMGMLGFLLLVVLVVAAAVVYYVEQAGNSATMLTSIPQAMYFMQTTLTTTGYGDVTPLSWPGRTVTGVLMLAAIICLALPISVISANFTAMWTEHETMRRAAARSQQVWPNLQRLHVLLDKQRSAVQEVGSSLQSCQAAATAQIEAVCQSGRQARLQYLTSCAATQMPGSGKQAQAGLQALQEQLRCMRAQVAEAKQLTTQLQVLGDALTCMHATAMVPHMDRLHLAHKGLRKWFEEGVLMAQEVKLLSTDIHALKNSLQIQSKPT